MKKSKVVTVEDRKRIQRYIRQGSPKVKKHEKFYVGKADSVSMADAVCAIWANLGKIRGRKGRRVYRNFPGFAKIRRLSRKALVGEFGHVIALARAEGVLA